MFSHEPEVPPGKMLMKRSNIWSLQRDPPPAQASVKGGHSNAAMELGNYLFKIIIESLIEFKGKL